MRFVVSTRLDDPPTPARVVDRLAREPSLRFKLDPTDDWSDELMAGLADLGAIDTLDMKGQYDDVPFGVPEDPRTYERILARFPDAWIEDPRMSPDIRAVLAGHEDRVTWDAPIHSVADIEALDWPPRMINVKPSRFGPLSRLFAAYDHLAAHGIGIYGGGQTELGPGRGQIQYLASLFHPDSPNDTAPSRLQRAGRAAGPAGQPAAGGGVADRLPLGGVKRRREVAHRLTRSRVAPSHTDGAGFPHGTRPRGGPAR